MSSSFKSSRATSGDEPATSQQLPSHDSKKEASVRRSLAPAPIILDGPLSPETVLKAAEEFFSFLKGVSPLHRCPSIPRSDRAATPPPRVDDMIVRSRVLLSVLEAALEPTQRKSIHNLFATSPFDKLHMVKEDASNSAGISIIHPKNERESDPLEMVSQYPVTASILLTRTPYIKRLEELCAAYQRIRLTESKSKIAPPHTATLEEPTEHLFVAFTAKSNLRAKELRLAALAQIEGSRARAEQRVDATFASEATADTTSSELAPLNLTGVTRCHRMELQLIPPFGSLMLVMTSSFKNLKIRQILKTGTIKYVQLGSCELDSTPNLIKIVEDGGTLIPRLLEKQAAYERAKKRSSATAQVDPPTGKFGSLKGAIFRFCRRPCSRGSASMTSLVCPHETPEYDETPLELHLPDRHFQSMPSRLAFEDDYMPPPRRRLPDPPGRLHHRQLTLLASSIKSRFHSARMFSSASGGMEEPPRIREIVTLVDDRLLKWLGSMGGEPSVVETIAAHDRLADECRILSLYFEEPDPLVFICNSPVQAGRVLQLLSITHCFLKRMYIPVCVTNPALVKLFIEFVSPT
eukprot:Blabericola_migrator_1__9021@NODE_47_length_16538_cov_123_101147_g43_i0_p3_GENE_NODE_47_length_16538_cov_123_101147_g43_i0NODE_47_length_16538_cov_123_101147_g43_i0_p3_ORF_typecomplete_len578_score77_85_NODE_47_length_16538_cov_123_101147_g43_i077149447